MTIPLISDAKAQAMWIEYTVNGLALADLAERHGYSASTILRKFQRMGLSKKATNAGRSALGVSHKVELLQKIDPSKGTIFVSVRGPGFHREYQPTAADDAEAIYKARYNVAVFVKSGACEPGEYRFVAGDKATTVRTYNLPEDAHTCE